MKVVIIGNENDIKLLKIEEIKGRYPDIDFIISSNVDMETKKDDLIIFLKEVDNFNILGKKALFLDKEIKIQDIFIVSSISDKKTNIYKANLLIDIFLD